MDEWILAVGGGGLKCMGGHGECEGQESGLSEVQGVWN